MSLVTHCPQCSTAFRVLPAQLSAKGGKVRCGKCTAVFDGVAHLAEQPAAGTPEPSPQLRLFEPGRAAHRASTASDTVVPATPPEPTEETPVVEFLAERKPLQHYNVAWGLMAVIAMTALIGQAAHYYRTELGVLVPDARPFLSAACEAIGCEVRLPRRPELMSIESSELQADGQREAVIVLYAVLRNRAPFPQEFPALELTLTDASEQPVARRVLAPLDYLRERGAAELVGLGIAPGAEAVLRVPLDTQRVTATGYRLYLFYP
jgi:predicted Zn finger-like uncharacterized protein